MKTTSPRRRSSTPAAATRSTRPSIRAKPVRAASAADPRLLPEHVAVSPTRRVDVRLFAPQAREVFLAGSFNGWQPGSTPMRASGDGHWEAELELNPGEYEYRFVADGNWVSDPLAPRFVANPFGDLNSVLRVGSD